MPMVQSHSREFRRIWFKDNVQVTTETLDSNKIDLLMELADTWLLRYTDVIIKETVDETGKVHKQTTYQPSKERSYVSYLKDDDEFARLMFNDHLMWQLGAFEHEDPYTHRLYHVVNLGGHYVQIDNYLIYRTLFMQSIIKTLFNRKDAQFYQYPLKTYEDERYQNDKWYRLGLQEDWPLKMYARRSSLPSEKSWPDPSVLNWGLAHAQHHIEFFQTLKLFVDELGEMNYIINLKFLLVL